MSEKPKLDKEKYDEIAGKVDKHVEKGKKMLLEEWLMILEKQWMIFL